MSVDGVELANCGTETMVSNAVNSLEDIDFQRSILLADVAGSARLYEKLGSAEAARAVDRCLKRMERAAGAFDGRVVKIVGDELMAVFESADEAFQAANEMQLRVADLPPVSGVKLEIRVAFSHGAAKEDDGRFDGETVGIAACLAGIAAPGQVLTNAQTIGALSPSLAQLTNDLGTRAVGKDSQARLHVFEVMQPEMLSPAIKNPEGASGKASEGVAVALCVRYMGKKLILDESRPLIRMGRDTESDAVVRDRRASRHHATVELRNGRIVLIDRSTNGTYVTLSGQPELALRKGECILHGRGLICFASSASNPDADFAEFEQL